MNTETKETFCPSCGVPLSQHSTCCGWENANTIFFPWEHTIPAYISPLEKKIRYEYRNDMTQLMVILPKLPLSTPASEGREGDDKEIEDIIFHIVDDWGNAASNGLRGYVQKIKEWAAKSHPVKPEKDPGVWVKASEGIWEYGKPTVVKYRGEISIHKHHNVLRCVPIEDIEWLDMKISNWNTLSIPPNSGELKSDESPSSEAITPDFNKRNSSSKNICDFCDSTEEEGHESWCPEAKE